MSVDQANLIDFISLENVQDAVSLVVSDHLDWSRSLEHQLILQNKLNAYIAFVESRQLYEQFPDASGRKIQIQIVFKYEPDPDGLKFIDRARSFLEKVDIRLSYKVGIDHQL